MKDPRGWLLRQIRRHRFEALKVGRHYRMTQEQIDAARKTISTTVAPEVEQKQSELAAQGLSLTATSARRLRTA
jgi:hypothetical protein